MADITLVNINLLYVRYFDSVEKELHVPLGTLYLTSVLERAGFEVDFRDYQLTEAPDPFDAESIAEFLDNPAPVLGVSCMANLLPFTILALREFRGRHPDTTIVLGGVGPFSVEGKVLERFPWIDIVSRGEAEHTIVDLMRALKNGRDLSGVDGIFYRENGRIVETAPRERITDLDSIPLPAFHRVNLNDYEGYGVVSSRGCPYPCTFCSVAPIWGRAPQFRSNESIIGEMRVLNEKAGVDLFLFQDEFFVSSKERVISFCRDLEKSGLDVQWKAFGRVNLTDRETMEAMSRTGCIEIRYGIESASDRVLERTKKGFGAEESVSVVSEAAKIFPRVDAFFVWGFPFETMDDFNQTVFQMVSFRLMGARILPSLLCFLPQTDIYLEFAGSEKFEFCGELLPEYMLTGHETSRSVRVSISDKHSHIFSFVQEHPDIFPGFFHYDLEGNVLPKFEVLQEFGFYPGDKPETGGTDSCGAHSPRVAATGLDRSPSAAEK